MVETVIGISRLNVREGKLEDVTAAMSKQIELIKEEGPRVFL
jgi:hypothetical protein